MPTLGSMLSLLMPTLLMMTTQAAASGALPYANALDCVRTMVAQEGVRQQAHSAPLAAPQLGSCSSSGRAWRRCAARPSQGEAGLRSAPPLPRLLESDTSKASNSTAAFAPGGCLL
jgi:hypothetical protein